MYNILTSFNDKYWNEVAQTSVNFLDKMWHKSSKIYLYHELGNAPLNGLSKRVEWVNFHKACPQWRAFAEKHKDDPMANGGDGHGGNFKLDAIKFTHKTFAIWDLYKKLSGGWLIWIDCDAFLINDIDKQFINDVFKDNIVVSYVGRPGKYSECGFLAFNLNNSKTIDFLSEWENLYTSGDFLKLPETHDSWTFDYIRLKWNLPELFNDLNAGTLTNKNPFSNSKLKNHFVHAKGSDKVKTMNKLRKRFKID